MDVQEQQVFSVSCTKGNRYEKNIKKTISNTELRAIVSVIECVISSRVKTTTKDRG